jgi:hypothetical protein
MDTLCLSIPLDGDETSIYQSALLVAAYNKFVAQGLWGTETACQVGLSGVCDLDKWRGAGMPNCEVGKPALYP